MTNINKLRREALSARVCGASEVPLQYPDARGAWFGDVRVMVLGEYLQPEHDAARDFDVGAVLVGGIDIISGLTREQIETLAEQAAWGKE
jgi:hypothetical protein